MNEIQKQRLTSQDWEIKNAAFKLGVFEIFTNKEDDNFFDYLVALDRTRFLNNSLEVLKLYPDKGLIWENFLKYSGKLSAESDVLTMLAKAYEAAKGVKKKQSVLEAIENYPAGAAEKVVILMPLTVKTAQMKAYVHKLLPFCNDNALNEILLTMKLPQLELYPELLHKVKPAFIGRVLNIIGNGCWWRESGQHLLDILLDGKIDFVNLYVDALFPLLISREFPSCVPWQLKTIVSIIESRKLKASCWKEWSEALAVKVVEEARRNAEVWDRIEPVCKKAARADKEQLPLIITFVEDCARYAATDKPEGTKFIWMKCAAGKYVAPVSRKALLLEFFLIRHLVNEEARKEYSAFYPQVMMFLARFHGNRQQNERRDEAWDKLKAMTVKFSFAGAEHLIEQAKDALQLEFDNRHKVLDWLNRLIADNDDLFVDKEDYGLDWVSDFNTFCLENQLKVPAFTRRYGSEVHKLTEERHNKERILAELALPPI